MRMADNCVTLAEAAALLSLDLAYLRRSKVRGKLGLVDARHPSCLDDRVVFLSRDSLQSAADALAATRELRVRTKKMEPAQTGSILKNAQ